MYTVRRIHYKISLEYQSPFTRSLNVQGVAKFTDAFLLAHEVSRNIKDESQTFRPMKKIRNAKFNNRLKMQFFV